MSKKNVFLWGYYGSYNVGDDILLRTIVNELLSSEKVNKITISCNTINAIDKSIVSNKKVYLTEVNNNSGVRGIGVVKNIIGKIRLIKKNDVVIFGGGTTLFEIPNRGPQSLLSKYIILLTNRVIFRKKVIHLGVGIGNFYTKFGKWLLTRIVGLSDMFLLRDKSSFEKLMVPISAKTKVILGSDLMLLNNFTGYEIQLRDNSKFKIGLSFFQYYGYISNEVDKKDKFFQQIIELIEDLYREIPHAEFYLFSFQKEKGGRDEEFNNKLISYFKEKKEDVYHITYGPSEEIIREIKNMNLCIGMRYHFNLISLFSNIKAVGVNYQPKVYNEFTQLGIEEYTVDISNIAKIVSLVKCIGNEKANLSYQRSYDRLKGKQQELRVYMDEILSTL